MRLQFADQADYKRALREVTAIGADERLRTVEVGTDGSAASIYALLGLLQAAGAPAARVSVDRPSLDDVFMSLTDNLTETAPDRESEPPMTPPTPSATPA